MKKLSQVIVVAIVVIFLATGFSLFGQYQNKNDQYLNAFAGPIDMRVMRFGQQLSIDIISPTSSLLGYAHRPSTTRDKQMVNEFYRKMQEYFRFVNVSRDGQCRFNELDLDNPFFALYMNEYEAEYLNKFDEERGNLNVMNRGLINRYNAPPQKNYNRLTRSRINTKSGITLNPYYFATLKSFNNNYPGGRQGVVGKYQSVTVDREQLNRARYYVNDKRLTESELRDQRNFEYIYDLGNQEGENTQTTTPAPLPETLPRPNIDDQFNSYSSDLNYNQSQPQRYTPQPSQPSQPSQPPANNYQKDDNYNIAKQGLSSGSYQQPMQTETDIAIRFSCNAGDRLSYVDFREFFDTFPKVTLIYTQVVTEDGQYNIELDKRNSTVYLR